jgi:hypothetical protein
MLSNFMVGIWWMVSLALLFVAARAFLRSRSRRRRKIDSLLSTALLAFALFWVASLGLGWWLGVPVALTGVAVALWFSLGQFRLDNAFEAWLGRKEGDAKIVFHQSREGPSHSRGSGTSSKRHATPDDGWLAAAHPFGLLG